MIQTYASQFLLLASKSCVEEEKYERWQWLLFGGEEERPTGLCMILLLLWGSLRMCWFPHNFLNF